jgi:hypothetical protein
MKLKITIVCIFISFASLAQQRIKLKADKLYFELKYKQAIIEYKKLEQKNQLTQDQYFKLANAYYMTKNYKKAANLYNSLYAKNPNLPTAHYNKLLQSVLKTDGVAGVQTKMSQKKGFLSKQLAENAQTNFKILETPNDSAPKFNVFSLSFNSRFSDFSPTFYNNYLLFSSSKNTSREELYEPANEPFLDIFKGTISSTGQVTNVRLFKEFPNSAYHEATPYYSQELEQIFYSVSNLKGKQLEFDNNGVNALGINAVKTDNMKRKPMKFFKDLGVNFYYPFYDAKNSILYFCANLPDSYGGTDLYYVFVNANQIMSKPINLGPTINTPGNEISPFVHEDMLYFSSDIFYGMGGMDIYKATIGEEQTYGAPINLGASINSSYDDFGFIIRFKNARQLEGYFASNRPGGAGKDDIYGFTVERGK